jgi:hypothetical protein
MVVYYMIQLIVSYKVYTLQLTIKEILSNYN